MEKTELQQKYEALSTSERLLLISNHFEFKITPLDPDAVLTTYEPETKKILSQTGNAFKMMVKLGATRGAKNVSWKEIKCSTNIDDLIGYTCLSLINWGYIPKSDLLGMPTWMKDFYAKRDEILAKNPEMAHLPSFMCRGDGKKPSPEVVSKIVADAKNMVG